jgi:putative spermidine/putrescine transport system permease protein
MSEIPAPGQAQAFRPGALSLFGDRLCTFLVRAILVAGALFLLAPLVAVIGTAFNKPPAIVFPPSTLTFDSFRQIPSAWYVSFLTSLELAALAALIGLAVTLPAAFGLVRGLLPGRAFVETFLRSPLQVPQVVLSVSIYQYYVIMQGLFGTDVMGGFRGLVVAHILLVSPYILGTLVGRIAAIDQAIEEAAEGLGASAWRTFAQITVPAIRPALFASLVLAFVISFDNVTLSLFLSSDGDGTTLPVTLFSAIEMSASPVVFAAAAMTVVVSAIVTFSVERLIGLRAVVAR